MGSVVVCREKGGGVQAVAECWEGNGGAVWLAWATPTRWGQGRLKGPGLTWGYDVGVWLYSS
jgi:hypothetical protein